MEALLPLLITFGLMWVLLIRPQKRRVEMQQAVVASLRPGDEIITSAGIHGTIVSVDDDTLLVEVAPGVSLRMVRQAVSQRIGPDDDEDDVAGDTPGAKEDES
jgi:preprotein translocase subunit YajC